MNGFLSHRRLVPVSLTLLSIAATLLPIHAFAATIGPVMPPTLTLYAEENPSAIWEYQPSLQSFDMNPGGEPGLELRDEMSFDDVAGGRADVTIKEIEFDPDPFVLHNILVTNATAVTQSYNLTIALPTAFPAPNIISGNVRTDVIDGGGAPGGTVSTFGGFPIYAAQIDGATVATLQDDPFSVTAPAAGSAGSAASFGPSVNAVPVTASIGIQLRFSLTPGDTAAILSRFDVVAIPEPASLVLGALAMLAVAFVSRRPR